MDVRIKQEDTGNFHVINVSTHQGQAVAMDKIVLERIVSMLLDDQKRKEDARSRRHQKQKSERKVGYIPRSADGFGQLQRIASRHEQDLQEVEHGVTKGLEDEAKNLESRISAVDEFMTRKSSERVIYGTMITRSS